METRWRSAWVTGASSGIGRALAVALTRGGTKVAASARSANALSELAHECPGVAPLPLDVTDAVAMTQAARSIATTLGALDLAIFGAGIWLPMSARNFSAARAAQSMAVNYQGVVNGIEAVLPAMIERRAGHIAIIASVAGYCGVGATSAYGPTKAALINLAETLRNDLADQGVRLSLINPGYVDTPMTRSSASPKPFMISAEDAAGRILAGLEKEKFEIAFPWPLVALMKLGRLMPYPAFFGYARSVLSPPRNAN